MKFGKAFSIVTLLFSLSCQTTEVKTWDQGFPGTTEGMTRVGKEDVFRTYAVSKIDRDDDMVLISTVAGPRRIAYTIESFTPVFVNISPKSADHLADAEDYHGYSDTATWIGRGGVVAIFLSPIIPPLLLVAFPAAIGGYSGSIYFDGRESDSFSRVRESYLDDLNRYVFAEELTQYRGKPKKDEQREIPKT